MCSRTEARCVLKQQIVQKAIEMPCYFSQFYCANVRKEVTQNEAVDKGFLAGCGWAIYL